MFVGEGAKVVVGDVLDDQAKALADEINRKAGARVIVAVHLDVARAADWRAAVETCEREFGGLDILGALFVQRTPISFKTVDGPPSYFSTLKHKSEASYGIQGT